MGRLTLSQEQRHECYAQARVDLDDLGAALVLIEPGDSTRYEVAFTRLDATPTSTATYAPQYADPQTGELASYFGHYTIVTVLTPGADDGPSGTLLVAPGQGVNAFDVRSRTAVRATGSVAVLCELINAVLASIEWQEQTVIEFAAVLEDVS